MTQCADSASFGEWNASTVEYWLSRMPQGTRATYRHGNIPRALCSAARQILERGDIEGVALREAAFMVGISPTAAYRHFKSKDDWLAVVAAQGFRELAAVLRTAARSENPAIAIGLAYIDFALTNRGLFHLMFGPILLLKEQCQALNDAVADAREAVGLAVEAGGESQAREDAAFAMWSLYQGVSAVFIGGSLPEADAKSLAQKILIEAGRRRRYPVPRTALIEVLG